LVKLRIWDRFVCPLARLIVLAHTASEAADAFAEISHRLGNSTSPEEHQHDDCNDKPVTDRHAAHDFRRSCSSLSAKPLSLAIPHCNTRSADFHHSHSDEIENGSNGVDS
jgi:hypothetical protein